MMQGYSNSNQGTVTVAFRSLCVSSTLGSHFLKSKGPSWLSRKHLVLPIPYQSPRNYEATSSPISWDITHAASPTLLLWCQARFEGTLQGLLPCPMWGEAIHSLICSDFSILLPHSRIIFLQPGSWPTDIGYSTSVKGLTKDSLFFSNSHSSHIPWNFHIVWGEKDWLWLILYPFKSIVYVMKYMF